VVVLTIHEDLEYRARAEAAGASAFVPKRTMWTSLLPVLRDLVPPADDGAAGGAAGEADRSN
jgi:DNA-binding NarL/FixJ family response regulator